MKQKLLKLSVSVWLLYKLTTTMPSVKSSNVLQVGFSNLMPCNIVQKKHKIKNHNDVLLVSQISNQQPCYKQVLSEEDYISNINSSFERMVNQMETNTLSLTNVPDFKDERQKAKKLRRDNAYERYNKKRKQIHTLADLPPLDES